MMKDYISSDVRKCARRQDGGLCGRELSLHSHTASKAILESIFVQTTREVPNKLLTASKYYSKSIRSKRQLKNNLL